jgi:hypothetical protein
MSLEIGGLFRVGDRSVSQERRRWRDRLSDDRNAQDLFKGFLGKCIEELTPWPFLIHSEDQPIHKKCV